MKLNLFTFCKNRLSVIYSEGDRNLHGRADFLVLKTLNPKVEWKEKSLPTPSFQPLLLGFRYTDGKPGYALCLLSFPPCKNSVFQSWFSVLKCSLFFLIPSHFSIILRHFFPFFLLGNPFSLDPGPKGGSNLKSSLDKCQRTHIIQNLYLNMTLLVIM